MLLGLLLDRLSGSRIALAVAALIVVAMAGGGLAGSARADDAQVTIALPGGARQTLSLIALAGSDDVVDRSYLLRSSQGESTTTVTGFSLAAILEAAGAEPFGFSYLEVQRPAGGAVLLSRHQALDPGAFAEGPPVLYATAGGTGFVRPSGNEEDLNANDSFTAPQGVTVVLQKGSPLHIRARASTVRARVGKTVSFNAVVDGAGSGEQLEYSWYFDDGHSASGPEASHSFARRGSFDVVVGVTTPGDRAGTSAVVSIQVGAPLSGPDRKGGGSRHEAAAPDHGAVAGTHGAVPPGPASASYGKGGVGPVVSGELVRAAGPIDAAKPNLPGARTGQLDANGGGGGVPEVAIGLFVTAGLLGLGALIEARTLHS